jgi:long-chain fatty acid transport protein
VRTAILALLLLVAPSLAVASGYALPNTNPRDLSMSASAVAAQRDAGATFALPAALARMQGLSVTLGAGAVNVFAKWTDPTAGATLPPYVAGPLPSPTAEPGTAHLAAQATPFPNAAISYGGRLAIPGLGDRGWGVGLSVEPFGGARVKWPDGWAGRYRIESVDRRVFSGVLGAGIELHPQIRLGGGLVYYYTWETLTQKVWMEPWAAPPALTPGTPDAVGKLKVSGGAFSYDASIEIDPLQGVPFTVAVDYKHKATQDLSGDVTWNGVQPFFSTPAAAVAGPLTQVVTARSAHHQLTIPNTLNVGLAYRLVPPVLLTFTYTFDRWVVYDSDLFVANTGGSINVPRNYGNGHTFRAGVEWSVTPMWQLRAGLQRDQSGLSRATYSPTLPDQSSWAGSLGAGIKLGAFGVDAAIFYARMDRITATNVGREPGAYSPTDVVFAPTGSFRGSYEPEALVYSLAVGWTPGAAR